MTSVNSVKTKTDITQAMLDSGQIDATNPTGKAELPSWSKATDYSLATHASLHSSTVTKQQADKSLQKILHQLMPDLYDSEEDVKGKKSKHKKADQAEEKKAETEAKTDIQTPAQTDKDLAYQKTHSGTHTGTHHYRPDKKLPNIDGSDFIFDYMLDKDEQLEHTREAIIENKNAIKELQEESLHDDELLDDIHKLQGRVDIDIKKLTIGKLGQINPQQMMMLATLVSIKAFSATAEATIKASKIMTDTQIELRQQNLEKLQDQMQQQAEQARKAHKAGIFTALFDWVISAAEAIYGVIKLVEGVARVIVSGGADLNAYMEVASGATYLAAGCAGFVKAAAETAALSPKLSEAQKAKCLEIAKYAGYVQLGCEVAGLAVDIMQGGMAFKAARGAAKAVKTGVEAAAPELIENIGKAALKAGEDGASEAVELTVTEAKQALKEATKDIAKEVSEEIGNTLADKITSEAMQNIVKDSSSKVVQKTMSYTSDVGKNFGKEAVEKMAEKAVDKAVKKAIKKAIKKGIQEITAETLKKSAGRYMTVEIIKASAKVGANLGIHMIQGALAGGNQINAGTIKEIKRKIQAVIDTLSLDMQLLEFVNDWYDHAKDQEVKTAKDLVNKQATTLQGGTQAITETGSLQARLAGSIV